MGFMKDLRTTLRLVITLGLLSGLTAVWAEVQMKSRDGQSRLNNRTSSAKSRVANRSHLILDFPETPTPETARQLASRGMRVVAYLPLTGLIVGVDGQADLQGLNVTGFDALQREDKLSHELALAAGGEGRGASRTARRSFYVVEFHGDIPWEERRSLVSESGVEIKDHRDLVGDHMLVRGTLQQMRSLAEWDEVAYIFPASGELATGLPLVGCLGGATEAGQVGQLTQRIGEGWDGPGRNSANLTYSLQGAVSTRLGEGPALAEIQRAMAAWAAVVKVDFKRSINATAMKNINILFGSRDHGDPYPFDGAGKVLAHTFYPSAPNPEPLAGDLHFDNDENWNIGTDIDLYSVALHELGHALGLGHSDVPNAVMYPYYRRSAGLTPEDIGAIQMLYAAATDAPAPAPLVVTISSPSNLTASTTSAITVSGTVTGPTGSPAIAWRTNRGASGTGTITADGTGGYRWQLVSVPLSMGENSITVTASDTTGRSVNKTLEVQREAAPVTNTPTAPVPPTPPTAAPQPTPTPTPNPAAALNLTLTSPAVYNLVIRNLIAANGIVVGGTGKPSVRLTSDRGVSFLAVVTATTDGSYKWNTPPLPLQLGVNNITVTATDTANRTSRRTAVVIYRYPNDEDPEDVAPTPAPVPTPTPAPTPAPTPTPAPVPTFNLAVSAPGADTVVTLNPFTASGTVAGATSRPAVRWSSDRGFNGTAVVTAAPDGNYSWTANPIALLSGANTITVTATDSDDRTSVQSFRVTYKLNTPADPDADDQAPRITVLTPNTSFLMTNIYSLSVRGTAFDFSGVSEVRWECSCGSQGIAQGTTTWTIPNISLPVGTFTIKIIAKDLAGNEGTTVFTVFRYEN